MSEDVSEATLGFEGFVVQKGRALWRAAWLLTGDSQHAEDLVQTALSKTYTRYDDIGCDAQFEAYVRTTIYRTFVSWWRKLSWRNEKAAEVVGDAAAPESHGVNLDLIRALDELPRMQRAVLVLQYFEDPGGGDRPAPGRVRGQREDPRQPRSHRAAQFPAPRRKG